MVTMASMYRQACIQAENSLARYRALPISGKIAVWAIMIVNNLFLAWIVWYGPRNVFHECALWAGELRDQPFGYVYIILAMTVTSMPPLLGYGTLVTICGFTYGLHGWWVASAGCLLGSAFSFLFCRRFTRSFAAYLEQEPRFLALGTAVRHKGLPLVALIRLCPFPFTYSNLFFASIESVSLWQFMVATLCITPKLFLHVWIGQRMFLLSDPNEREEMDSTTKIVNIAYIVLGTLLGLATGLYVYRLTMQYVQQIALDDDTRLEEGLTRPSTDEQVPLTQADDEDDVDVDELDRQLLAEGIDPKSTSFRDSIDDSHGNWDRFSEDWGSRSDDGEGEDALTPSNDRNEFIDPDATPRAKSNLD